jgi:hypothetical protein
MKFVKTITILMSFVVMAFGNDDRVNALGGNPGFWAEDDANVYSFPAMVNSLDMVQVTGAGSTGGTATVIWGEGTTWGFSFDGSDSDDDNDWLNLMWGNGTYGAIFSLGSSATDNGLSGDANVATSTFDMGVSFGMNQSFGELGVMFMTGSEDNGDGNDDTNPSTVGFGLNLRRAQDVWLFNNMLVGFNNLSGTMGDASAGVMDFSCDLYTSLPTGDGVTAIFSLGLGYSSHTMDDGLGNDDSEMTMSTFTLPNATLGVEADVTDWATVRFGMNHAYVVAGSNGDATWTGTKSYNDDMELVSNFNWDFGLGFDYGSFTLDMVLENTNLFNDPVRYVTGRNDDALSSSATLTWKF